MAEIAKRLAANVPGEFFVDSTCIDCGTCRQVAPATFAEGRDDVADHAKFHQRFGCERILHSADVTRSTSAVELKLSGEEPQALDEEALFIPVPGHTPGSTCLLYREKFLFSGDHAWWDPRK